MKTKTIVEKRKSVSLKVIGDTLIIKQPHGLKQEVLDAFIERKREWITKQLQLNQKFNIDFDSPLILFNKPIELRFQSSSVNEIECTESVWLVKYKRESQAIKAVRQKLNSILLQKIETRLCELQNIKSFSYLQIKIKNLTSSWGNCNSRRVISFSSRLIHMKESFIDSVVAHEVSHLFVMNHSISFYQVLSQFDPDYRSSIKDQLDL